MIPYDMPGGDQTPYEIDPPCVMDQVEAAVRECLETRAVAGRDCSLEDRERCHSPSGFTKPLSGETPPHLPEVTLV